MSNDRRKFLKGASGALALLPVLSWLPRDVHAAARLELAPLADGIWRVQGAAANLVVASSGDGLLLVDGGAAADARALERLLAKQFPKQPIRAVFNTHWHPPHSGFNATARRLGADVIAHENTKLWLGTEVNARWEGRVYPAQPAAALPNRTFFYGPQTLDFGGRKVEYGHLGQAHTDGDIFVRFPDANLIVAGDVVTPGRYPIVDPASNGWLGGVFSATKNLAGRCDAATRILPGSGEPCALDALKAQEELCYTVLTRIGESYYKGQTYADLIASKPAREFEERYGDPAVFLKTAYDSAWYHVNEIRRVAR